MSDLNQQALAQYRNNFLKEVEERVEEGDWVKMCMQCGVCAGSCPFGPHWEHSPQKIFMMIRAGKREEVLKSDSMWMCTSCYNCVVRCPRKLPITQIMHGLATYAHRLGLAPEEAADARLLQHVLGQLHQDRPRQRTEAHPGPVLQGRPRGRASRRRWTMRDIGAGHAEGQAPEPDGAVRRPRAARTRTASSAMLKKAQRNRRRSRQRACTLD